MSNENNKFQIDIENLFKQNVNDLSAIKELYSKLEELGEKFTQIKYIDSTLANKLKKEYEKLKKIILDENIQVKLTNDIEETKNVQVELNNKIEETKNEQVELNNKIEETKTELNEVSSQMEHIANDQKNKETFASDIGITPNNDISDLLINYLNSSNNSILKLQKGTYIISKDIDIAKGIKLYGNNESIIKSTNNSRFTGLVTNDIIFKNITFDGITIDITKNKDVDSAKVIIENNTFLNTSNKGCIYFGVAYNKLINNAIIKNNTFINNSYGIKGCTSNTVISSNIFKNNERNIELNGGNSNVITENNIDSGKTGICFLIDFVQSSRTGANNNIITNNTITGTTEEAISFDCFGNYANNCSVSITKPITAISYSGNNRYKITIDGVTPYGYLNNRVNHINSGQSFIIEDMPSSGTLIQILKYNDTTLSVDDVISIGASVCTNIIKGNTINSNSGDGILLYGNCNGFIIESNSLYNSSLAIRSISGLLGDRVALCNNNIVRSNTLYKSILKADLLVYGNYNIYKSFYNKFIDNILIDSSKIVENQNEFVDSDNILINSLFTND